MGTMTETIMIMADGDAIALSVLARLTDDMERIFALKNLNITGSVLSKLYMELCDRDMEKLKITIDMLDYGTYSKEEISENLASEAAYPFFDASIESREFLIALPYICRHTIEWDKFCNRQKTNYLKKQSEKVEQDKKPTLRALKLTVLSKVTNPFM